MLIIQQITFRLFLTTPNIQCPFLYKVIKWTLAFIEHSLILSMIKMTNIYHFTCAMTVKGKWNIYKGFQFFIPSKVSCKKKQNTIKKTEHLSIKT